MLHVGELKAEGETTLLGRMRKPILRRFNGFIFDLDGTVYLGEELIEGADEVIERIRSLGKRVLFVSNKPIATRESYAGKLTRLGIKTSPDEVINSSFVLTRYLSRIKPGARVFPIGEESLINELEEAGFRITDTPDEIEVVVLAMDRTFNYAKLLTAYRAAIRGAFLIATNPDPTCPMDNEEIPDCASIIAALEACSGRKVEVIVGKPSPIMVEEAMRYLNLPPQRCVITGDRLSTDIAMGKGAGIFSILVLTGVTDRRRLRESEIKPDLVLEGIWEMLELI
jgi:phosphoglycolate/pyridoxal phosphate phosphatase family enzyme